MHENKNLKVVDLKTFKYVVIQNAYFGKICT